MGEAVGMVSNSGACFLDLQPEKDLGWWNKDAGEEESAGKAKANIYLMARNIKLVRSVDPSVLKQKSV